MSLYRETITGKMAEIADIVSAKLDPEYYLAGGTALALLIGHRKSVDLDYFIAKNIDTRRLRQEISDIFSGHDIEFTYEEKNTLWCSIDGVKVSFISRFEQLLEKIESVDVFRLAGMHDLVIMKLGAICGREEYKDYFDLACLSKITDVRSWLLWWQTVNPRVDATSWLVALAAVDHVSPVSLDVMPAYESVNVAQMIHEGLTEITKQLR